MECQPLCVSPYVRAGGELRDLSCKKEMAAEEPCCALVLCPASPGVPPCSSCKSNFNSRTEVREFISRFTMIP